MRQMTNIKVTLEDGYYFANYTDEDGEEYVGTGNTMSDALYALADDLACRGL